MADPKRNRWTPEEDEELLGLIKKLGDRHKASMAFVAASKRSASGVKSHIAELVRKGLLLSAKEEKEKKAAQEQEDEQEEQKPPRAMKKEGSVILLPPIPSLLKDGIYTPVY